MPYKCSVKGCRSNYDSSHEKVSLFHLPADSDRKSLWLSKIQLNSKPTRFSRVCIKHFTPDDIDNSARRCMLKPFAVPKALNEGSRKIKEEFVDQNLLMITEDSNDFETEPINSDDQIRNFTQLCDDIEEMKFEDWHIYMTNGGICFYQLSSDEGFSKIEMTFKILINKSLRMKLFNLKSESSTEELNWVLKDGLLQKWSQLIDILAHYQQTQEIIPKNDPKRCLKKAYEVLDEIQTDELHEQVNSVKAKLSSLYDFANTLQDIEDDFYTQPLVESFEVANETNEDILEPFLDDDTESTYEVEEFKDEETQMMKEEVFEVQEANDETSESFETKDPLVCFKCSIKFLSAAGLRSHEKTCNFNPSKISNSKTDKEMQNCNIEMNICDICGKQFSLMKRLKEHMKLHDQNLRKKCPHCEIILFSGILQRHIRTVHDKSKPHKCSFCNKAFSTSSLLNFHKKTHTLNLDLQKNIKQVNGSPRYCCPKCSADFETSSLLRKHIENNCRLTQKKRIYRYPCRDCSKKFSTKTQAAKHLLSIHKVMIKNIEKFCFECNAEFDDYVNHIRTHSCNFACRFCGSKFLTEEKLKNHEETKHATETEEDRPFKCKEKDCELSFKNVNHLRSHCQAIHIQQERDFECQQCSKKFGLKAHLTVHVRQHNASFPCNFMDCQRVFKKLNNLKEHFERDHGISEIYLCNIDECGERFKMLQQLKNHRTFSHGVAFNISKYFEK